MSARPPPPETLVLRKELLHLRAAADRIELLEAIGDLQQHAAPLAGAARRLSSAARFLSGSGGGRVGWAIRIARTLVRHPWATSLMAATFSRVRRRRLPLLGIVASTALALGVWWVRRDRSVSPSAPPEFGTDLD
jgi:hypothetical protein